MAEAVNKNQHTLYRFVSLRNPELSKKEDQTKRFVFHPDNKTGAFFTAMTARTSGQTKWDNLLNTSVTFTSSAIYIPTVEKLEAIVDNVNIGFFEFANWLTINRTNYKADEIVEKIGQLNITEIKDLKIELNLWDNLFYQVVTQKDFYIKENIIHILVVNNLLKEFKTLTTDAEKIEFLPVLTQARVVLPTILFEEDTIIQNSQAKTSIANEPSIEDIQETNRSVANQNIASLETAQTEVIKLEKKYLKEYTKEYQKAVSEHEKLTKPLLDKYQNDWDDAKRKLCDVPKPENYDPNDFCNLPNVKHPVLPEFEFEFAPKLDNKSLENDLSRESYTALKLIDALDDNDTYTEILEKIQVAIQSEQKKVVENTSFSTPVLLIGGVAISLKSNNSTFSRGKDVVVNPAFVPERFGVRNIGIADYKKVVSHVCCYDAGEVSHIENIMAKELRSKTTTREHIEENTEISETSQEKESLTDTSTTDRFEMQTEVSKILQEDKQFGAYANMLASYGSVSLDVGANYATNSSKEESNRQAVTQAKEITNRASERIVTKVRHETIKKTTHRFKEENIHAFDNTLGEHHVSGVYRFINSIYKNQIFNYGKRMMYEFMIPQPSKLHQLGMIENKNSLNTIKLEIPTNPKELGINSFLDINKITYQAIIAQYGVTDAKPYPEQFKTIGKSFIDGSTIAASQDSVVNKNEKMDLEIPKGYKTNYVTANIYARYNDNTGIYHSFGVTVGNINVLYSLNNNDPLLIRFDSRITPQLIGKGNPAIYQIIPLEAYTEKISIGYQVVNFFAINCGISIFCELTQEAITQWQKETYDLIIKAYNDRMSEYLASLENNQNSRESNPGFYRQIEQLVLRKNCISYLMDEAKMGQGFYEFTPPTPPSTTVVKDLAHFHISQTQEMDNYSSMVKFMEQAFDWSIMSYNFYPFYWGNRNDWSELYQYECNDPLFRNFMQSGMARVVVTVKLGFENAVLHFMATGQIWNGGEIPVLGNPLYLSIVDEIKEQEYVVEETWETVVPTSLIAIQESGVVIQNTQGLPCGTDCTEHAGNNFKINDATLGVKVKEIIQPIR